MYETLVHLGADCRRHGLPPPPLAFAARLAGYSSR